MVKIDRKTTDALFDELIGLIDDSPKGRRRKHVLSVATQLFTAQGYRKTSMDEVAQRAGISKVTVYGYFPTKFDLLVGAIALEKKAFMNRIAGVFDKKRPAKARLRELVVAILSYASHMPLAARLVRGDNEMAAALADAPPALMQRSEHMRQEFVGGLLAEVTGARGPEAMREEVDVLTGLAFFGGTIAEPHVRGALSVQRFAEVLTDLVLGGLKAKKGGAR